jgi:hypothetical protein
MAYTSVYDANELSEVIIDLIVGSMAQTYTFIAIIGLGVAAVVVLYLLKKAKS